MTLVDFHHVELAPPPVLNIQTQHQHHQKIFFFLKWFKNDSGKIPPRWLMDHTLFRRSLLVIQARPSVRACMCYALAIAGGLMFLGEGGIIYLSVWDSSGIGNEFYEFPPHELPTSAKKSQVRCLKTKTLEAVHIKRNVDIICWRKPWLKKKKYRCSDGWGHAQVHIDVESRLHERLISCMFPFIWMHATGIFRDKHFHIGVKHTQIKFAAHVRGRKFKWPIGCRISRMTNLSCSDLCMMKDQ